MDVTSIITLVLSIVPFMAYVLYNQYKVKDLVSKIEHMYSENEEYKKEMHKKCDSVKASMFHEVKKLHSILYSVKEDVTRVTTALEYQVTSIADLRLANRVYAEQAGKRVDDAVTLIKNSPNGNT
jgi:cell division protein FtsL